MPGTAMLAASQSRSSPSRCTITSPRDRLVLTQ